ncbi:hypothetical protein [Ferrimonas balearica]|uniref:hypothetical protein n=1 Tax=Ferrimonas balearica TaxID=44012 RepID=UPI001C9477C6|nr:hypothetical protein [Ferrimonas balearica]MBY5979132.1 hypothetical protein [Ferrimonas balearica]
MRRLRNHATPIAIALTVLLSSCGGDSDSDNIIIDDPNPAPLTGVFSDSPVSGLAYESASQQALTNANGEFTYLEGETLIFSIGGTAFPAVAGQAEVTPQTLYDGQDAHTTEVVNTLRLLQTLDSDGNPENGIQLDEALHTAMASTSLDMGSENFDAEAEAALENAGVEVPLVDEETALAHYGQGRDYQVSDLAGTWMDLFYDLPASANLVDGFAYAVDRLEIAPDGTTLATALVKSGNRELDSETLQLNLDSDGRLMLAEAPEWEAYLSADKDKFTVFDRYEGSLEFGMAIKLGSDYQQSDLAGQWYTLGVEMPLSSPYDPDLPYLYLDRWQVDNDGNLALYALHDGDSLGPIGSGELDDTVSAQLSSEGTITIAGDEEDAGMMYMARSKDVVVRHEHDNSRSALIVAVKPPEAITLADLEGTWRMYSFGLPPVGEMDPEGYSYDVDEMVIDAEGNVAAVHLRHVEWTADQGLIDEQWQSGGTYPSDDSWIDGAWEATFTLREDGLVETGGEELGVLAINASKDMMINYFNDDGEQGFALAVRLVTP